MMMVWLATSLVKAASLHSIRRAIDQGDTNIYLENLHQEKIYFCHTVHDVYRVHTCT